MAKAPAAQKAGAKSAAGTKPETADKITPQGPAPAAQSDNQGPAASNAADQQAKPEVITTAPKPDSASAPGGDRADAVIDGKAAETGKASGEVHAATSSPEAAPAPANPPDAHPLRTYLVRSPLRHNGRRYRPDDPDANTVNLTEAEADTLVAIGVLGKPA